MLTELDADFCSVLVVEMETCLSLTPNQAQSSLKQRYCYINRVAVTCTLLRTCYRQPT